MSQLDLKYAKLTIQDGYTSIGTFAVNHSGGYTTGTTTMVVDGTVGAVVNGDSFTMAGDSTVYVISAHSETSGNTTSITFAPGLVIAAIDNEIGTMLPNGLEIKIGQGTFTYDEKRKVDYVLERGLIGTVRLGDQEPLDVRFDFLWDFLRSISGATVPTIEDAFKQRGPASTWVTSAADKCEPYAVNLVLTYTPPCTGVQREIITLHDFRWESLNHDAKAGTVAVTGKCNVLEASIVRAA